MVYISFFLSTYLLYFVVCIVRVITNFLKILNKWLLVVSKCIFEYENINLGEKN